MTWCFVCFWNMGLVLSLARQTMGHLPPHHFAPRCLCWQIGLNCICINHNCLKFIYKTYKGLKYLNNILLCYLTPSLLCPCLMGGMRSFFSIRYVSSSSSVLSPRRRAASSPVRRGLQLSSVLFSSRFYELTRTPHPRLNYLVKPVGFVFHHLCELLAVNLFSLANRSWEINTSIE